MAAFLELPTNISESKIFKNSTQYLVYIAFILYFIAIFTMSSNDDNALGESKHAMWLIAIILPLVVFAYVLLSNIQEKKYFLLLFFMILLILFTLLRSALPSFDQFVKDIITNLTSVTEMPPLSNDSAYMIGISLKLILIGMFVVFLSIIYNVFLNESYRQKGKFGIFLYALFYIPCLLSDYVKYLFKELTTTPRVVYTLLFIELVLILLYIYLPRLISKVVLSKHVRIVKNPTMLYNKKQVSTIEAFYNRSDEYKILEKQHNIKNTSYPDDTIPNKSILKNYSLSMWVTVNPPSFSQDSECMIFRVGSDLGTIDKPDNPELGMPYIGCRGQKWRFVFSNNIESVEDLEKVSLELDLPFQKWNYLVFNYHDNQVDLFVNGVLTETKSLAEHLPIYNHSQVVCVGSDQKKVHGAICDVRVHSEI